MKRISRTGAYAVIIVDHKMLLCQLTHSRKWTLPGGGIEFGENPCDAMIREVLEETGYHAKHQELLGVNSNLLNRPEEDTELHFIQIVYRAEILSGELRIEQDGTTDLCEWVELGDLKMLEMSGVAEYSVNQFVQGEI